MTTTTITPARRRVWAQTKVDQYGAVLDTLQHESPLDDMLMPQGMKGWLRTCVDDVKALQRFAQQQLERAEKDCEVQDDDNS